MQSVKFSLRANRKAIEFYGKEKMLVYETFLLAVACCRLPFPAVRVYCICEDILILKKLIHKECFHNQAGKHTPGLSATFGCGEI